MNLKFLIRPKTLDVIIEKALQELDSLSPATPEYATALENVAALMKIKEQTASNRISADAALAVFGNLAGILLVINYEKIHIITTKAFGMVKK